MSMLRGMIIGSAFTSLFLLATQMVPLPNFSSAAQSTSASALKNIQASAASAVRTLYDGQPLTNQNYTIVAGGDIMLDRGVLRSINRNTESTNYTFPFQEIAPYTTSADLFIANLEGPLSDLGANQGSKYSFRFAPKAIDGLAHAGVDVVSLANNHALDWGHIATCDTTKNLQNAGIASHGAGCNYDQANAPYITQLGDTTVAFLSFTNLYPASLEATRDKGGISDTDPKNWIRAIEDLRKEKDVEVVIVSVHWGDEYKTRSNGLQQRLARQLISAGADVILGHHPHVTQEIEKIDDGWVVYSLGNLIFDQSFSEETMRGYFAEISIERGEVTDIKQKDYLINDDFQPYFPQDS